MATEAPSDVRERVTGYIKHQASKSNQAILDLVQKGHEQLMDGIDGVSDQQATFKPSADEWSVLDVMQHVVAAKKGVARMCQALARGEQPAGIGGEGQEEGDLKKQDGVTGRAYASLAEASAEAVKAHDELVAFVNSVSDESNTDTTFDHFLFGPLNCREWAVFQRVHDGDHGGQMDKVKAADGYPS
jgi:sulfur relay (sulfurtransferase) complex TusBCD TusD component (DsrE family)